MVLWIAVLYEPFSMRLICTALHSCNDSLSVYHHAVRNTQNWLLLHPCTLKKSRNYLLVSLASFGFSLYPCAYAALATANAFALVGNGPLLPQYHEPLRCVNGIIISKCSIILMPTRCIMSVHQIKRQIRNAHNIRFRHWYYTILYISVKIPIISGRKYEDGLRIFPSSRYFTPSGPHLDILLRCTSSQHWIALSVPIRLFKKPART